METKELEAGRELDALIAEKVMGRTDYEHGEVAEASDGHPVCARCGEMGYWGDKIFGDSKCIPFYSTDIAAAWQVVEKLRLTNWVEVIGFNGQQGYPSHNYECWTARHGETDANALIGFADAAPLAICRAALKVVSVGLG